MTRYERTDRLERRYAQARKIHRGQSIAYSDLFWQQIKNLRYEVREKKRLGKQAPRA